VPAALPPRAHRQRRLRRPRADAILADGTADLVSFGVPFIANPDLPRRLAGGGPFNTPDPSTFYGEGPGGYTDYPRSRPA
jgi:N-ethylmaleimide reductase